MISIKVPIWKGPAVGIKPEKLYGEKIAVEILYTDTKGNRTFPGVYRMRTNKAKMYPLKKFKKNLWLKVIPISDFEVDL